jgi:predicted O-methyltransferase YrrM
MHVNNLFRLQYLKMHAFVSFLSGWIFYFRHRSIAAVIKRLDRDKLSYHGAKSLRDLAKFAIKIEKRKISGAIIEAGCGLGGSAITLAAVKSKDRPLFVYDVFALHPPPSEKDDFASHQQYEIIKDGKSLGLGGNLYYGYEKNLYAKVSQSFADFGFETKKNNVHLIKGFFKNTLKVKLPISLAHIDCDWYESVMTCLKEIEPHLVRGGIIIVHSHWTGSGNAVQDYFKNKDRNKYIFENWDRPKRVIIYKK